MHRVLSTVRTRRNDGRLYVNINPDADPLGLFKCHRCGESGGLNKLRKHFGDPMLRDEDEVYRKPATNDRSMEIMKLAAEYYHDRLSNDKYKHAYQFLRVKRGLEPQTIKAHKLGYSDGTACNMLVNRGYSHEELIESGIMDKSGRDAFRNMITIPYHLNGNVVDIRGKDIAGKYKTLAGHGIRPFNIDSVAGETTVIICEGEFDSLIAEQLGYASVGIAGSTNWQDVWNPYLSNVKKAYLVFDTDKAGVDGAVKTAEQIGPKARIAELPEEEGVPNGFDLSDWIVKFGHLKEEFDMLLAEARGGILVTAEEAYQDWLENEGNPDRTGLKFGLDHLDEVITPGFLPGQVMIILAKTGAGKTISGLNMFHRMIAMKPDLKILFVSLEQTRSEWFERAWRINRFYDLEPDKRQAQMNALDMWRNNIMMTDKNRVTEEEFRASLEDYADHMGQMPDLVFVDYLGYWSRSYKGDAYERTSAAVMALKGIAKEYRIPIMSPHQVNRGNQAGTEVGISDARDSGAVEETADFLLSLASMDQKNIQNNQRTGEVQLKILKSRHGGVGTSVKMIFAPQSLAMVPRNETVGMQRAMAEVSATSMGEGYDQVFARHLEQRYDLPAIGNWSEDDE